MNVNKAALTVLLCSLAAAPAFSQQSGKVAGVVIDQFNAMTLPMAPIEIVETGEVFYTELDGRYSFELPPGPYQLKVTFAGYQEQLVSVNIAAGQTVSLDIAVSMERFSEEVTVTAEAETPQLFTAEAQLVERKKATVISDNLAAEDMRKNADSNAASAMRRVTGLTVVDNQYVFVRGLGERYSNTQLNGSTLPTTEPEKKVVPLDLFPSALIQSVQVQKTYMPDKQGDFTGGLVQIEPLSFPDRQVFDVSLSYGFNTETTFQDFQTYPGGSSDFLGYDDGTRALPSVIPTDQKVVRESIFTEGFTRPELQTFGRSFANVWEPRLSASAVPNQSYSVVWGNSTEKLGAVVSFAYNYKNQNQTEEQNFYSVSDEEISLQNAYDFEVSGTDTTMGLVGNLSYKIDGSNRIAFENFYTNNSSNETRVFHGFNQDINTEIVDSRLLWVEESIYSGKVSGEHFFSSLSNSRFDWRGSFSTAVRDEPDMRETLYEYNPAIDEFVLADESQSGFRMFNDLNDHVYELGADWSFYATQWSGLPAMIKVGPYVQFRDRDFSSRRFRFVNIAPGRFDISQPPEVLFSEENIGPNFELREETRATDTYTADQTITAGYGMIDLPFSERWRFVGGVRVERSEQNVSTFDLFAADPTPLVSNLDDTDVLPGLNVVYALNNSQNLRFGYRPDGESARVPGARSVRVHRRRRRSGHRGESRSAAGPDLELRRPLGVVSHLFRGHRGELLLQGLPGPDRAYRPGHLAASHLVRECGGSDERGSRDRGSQAGDAERLREHQLHLRRLRHRDRPSLGRSSDLDEPSSRRPVGKRLQRHGGVSIAALRLLDAGPIQLFRRPHHRRGLARPSGHPRRGTG